MFKWLFRIENKNYNFSISRLVFIDCLDIAKEVFQVRWSFRCNTLLHICRSSYSRDQILSYFWKFFFYHISNCLRAWHYFLSKYLLVFRTDIILRQEPLNTNNLEWKVCLYDRVEAMFFRWSLLNKMYAIIVSYSNINYYNLMKVTIVGAYHCVQETHKYLPVKS